MHSKVLFEAGMNLTVANAERPLSHVHSIVESFKKLPRSYVLDCQQHQLNLISDDLSGRVVSRVHYKVSDSGLNTQPGRS